jgi:hypothetical protein
MIIYTIVKMPFLILQDTEEYDIDKFYLLGYNAM